MSQVRAPGDDSDKLASVGDVLPGQGELLPDTRPGYLSYVTEAQRALGEAVFREQASRREATGKYLDPAWQTAQRARRELEAEARRRSKGDPRANLIAAHAAHDEATTAAARLGAAVAKATAFRVGVESRRGGIERALREADSEAIGRLLENFAGQANGGEPSAGGRTSALRSSLGQAEREFELANAALAKIEADLGQARSVVRRTMRALHLAALDLLVDHGCALAAEIAAVEATIASHRREADGIARFVSARSVRLHTVAPPLPPQLERLRFSTQSASGVDWEGVFAMLLEDPRRPLPGDEVVSEEPETA
jgi:hypothetical protein